MPEISVIIPVYKVEKYIHECVDSIINQTFQNLEIILVDDGSPDRCGEICDEYALKDNRVVVIHQKNAGLSAARNAGISQASGKYICFIDSDDYVSSDYCQTLFDLLDGTSFDYSVCSVLRFEDGEAPQREIMDTVHTYTNDEYLNLQINKQREFGVWNKLYRRELFDIICFKDGKLHEDVFWSADLANTCTNGVIETTKQCLYYRQRQGSIVATTLKKCSPDFIEAGDYVVNIAKKKNRKLYCDSLYYAIRHPWSYVDKIYVIKDFADNKKLLFNIQMLIRKYKNDYRTMDRINTIERKRMLLFAKSKLFYGCNAYARFFRVCLYKSLRKDPYKDGHGI